MSSAIRHVLSKTATRGSLSASSLGKLPVTPFASGALGGTSSFHSTAAATQDRHGTTILCVRKNGKVCIMGDGMVSMGSMIVKHNVNKIRRIPHKGEGNENSATIVGFAGSTADAFTLLERLEGKLDEYPGQLARSCVELAKGWRMDKYLRRLEASLIVADESVSLELTGNGDVLESQDGILGVGSGGPYAVGTYIMCGNRCRRGVLSPCPLLSKVEYIIHSKHASLIPSLSF